MDNAKKIISYGVYAFFALGLLSYLIRPADHLIRKAEITNDSLNTHEKMINEQTDLITVQCLYEDVERLNEVICYLSYFDHANSDPMLSFEKIFVKSQIKTAFDAIKKKIGYRNCKLTFRNRVVTKYYEEYAWRNKRKRGSERNLKALASL